MPSPKIEEIELSTLIQDPALSGRSEKELADSAKDAELLLKSTGGWSPEYPGKIVVRGKDKHLVHGFSRAKACAKLGYATGYFVRTEDTTLNLLTEPIRSNAGRPISQFEQGRIYANMRDGMNTETAAVGEEIRTAMKTDEIAKEVGKTRQHIEQCIAVFENPPEIAELIVSGAISAGAVIRAKQQVKDDKKLLKYLNAAVGHAKSEGKESATLKDLDAVKGDFVKLKAATASKPEATQSSPGITSEQTKEEARSSQDQEQEVDAPESQPAEQNEFSLLPESELQPAPKLTKKKKDQLRDAYEEVIGKWGDERSVAFSPADRDELVEALVAIQLPF